MFPLVVNSKVVHSTVCLRISIGAFMLQSHAVESSDDKLVLVVWSLTAVHSSKESRGSMEWMDEYT